MGEFPGVGALMSSAAVYRWEERNMQLGMIGLGKMGASMVSRLLQGGHECVVFDMKPDSVKDLASKGATGAASLDDFMAKLKPPRAVWLMVPAAAIEVTAQDLAARMQPGDIVIDGGNSYYTDDIRRARELKPKGIRYVDVDELRIGGSRARKTSARPHNGIMRDSFRIEPDTDRKSA